MFGRVTIYVDSEVITSFQGDMDFWKYREEFNVPRIGPMQTEIGKAPEPQLVPHKFISLKILAQLAGTVHKMALNGACCDVQYLCLFCYNYDNPTQKQMYLDVCMARGQMRNIL